MAQNFRRAQFLRTTGQVTRVLTNFGQLATGGTEWLERKVTTFTGWHEPCDWRQSSTVL